MRRVEQSSPFKRDMRRELKGKYRNIIAIPYGELWEVIDMLANDKPLALSYRDHKLTGNQSGKRECHLRFDFLLVYYYVGDDLLMLDRIGSHSEILGL